MAFLPVGALMTRIAQIRQQRCVHTRAVPSLAFGRGAALSETNFLNNDSGLRRMCLVQRHYALRHPLSYTQGQRRKTGVSKVKQPDSHRHMTFHKNCICWSSAKRASYTTTIPINTLVYVAHYALCVIPHSTSCGSCSVT